MRVGRGRFVLAPEQMVILPCGVHVEAIVTRPDLMEA